MKAEAVSCFKKTRPRIYRAFLSSNFRANKRGKVANAVSERAATHSKYRWHPGPPGFIYSRANQQLEELLAFILFGMSTSMHFWFDLSYIFINFMSSLKVFAVFAVYLNKLKTSCIYKWKLKVARDWKPEVNTLPPFDQQWEYTFLFFSYRIAEKPYLYTSP